MPVKQSIPNIIKNSHLLIFVYEQFPKKKAISNKIFQKLIITVDYRLFWPKTHAETAEHEKSWVHTHRYIFVIFLRHFWKHSITLIFSFIEKCFPQKVTITHDDHECASKKKVFWKILCIWIICNRLFLELLIYAFTSVIQEIQEQVNIDISSVNDKSFMCEERIVDVEI